MKASTAKLPEGGTGEELESATGTRRKLPEQHEPEGFIDTRETARRIGCSTGTVANMRASGRLPWVKIPGGRLVRFFWPDVQAALLRASRGGAQ